MEPAPPPPYVRSRRDARLPPVQRRPARRRGAALGPELQLRSQAEQAPLDRNRLAELEGLTRTANQTGYALVAARVVGMGPMQSFSRTVTIDAGTSSASADMTVLNNDGLVGRVISATRSTADVLLIVDTDSVVGGGSGPTTRSASCAAGRHRRPRAARPRPRGQLRDPRARATSW